MSFAILMTDAFSGPATDGVDNVGRAFNGTEAVLQSCMGGWESCLLLDLCRQKLIKIGDRQDWKASETKSPLLLSCF